VVRRVQALFTIGASSWVDPVVPPSPPGHAPARRRAAGSGTLSHGGWHCVKWAVRSN